MNLYNFSYFFKSISSIAAVSFAGGAEDKCGIGLGSVPEDGGTLPELSSVTSLLLCC